MVKKFLFFFFSCFTLISFARAGRPQQVPARGNLNSSIEKATVTDTPGDSTIVKDSVGKEKPAFVNDPKQGFKDLFVNASSGNDINSSQLNPRAISFVQDYVERNNKSLQKMKDWGRPYFNLIDGILVQHGLPMELKYLSVIESHLRSYSVSWAGAVGPWQFMPETARRLGLRVGRYFDDRTDYYKSTHAAARYLTELFAIYGDWLLVIAAYNGGPGNVNSAIRRSGSHDFWDLQYFLPTESRNHVKKFIATHYIMEGQGGLTTLSKGETADFLLTNSNALKNNTDFQNSKKIVIGGKYNSAVITKYTMMDIAQFNRMNPDFDKIIADKGFYEMNLPTDKMDLFLANKYQILNESVQLLLNAANDMKNNFSEKTVTGPEKKLR